MERHPSVAAPALCSYMPASQATEQLWHGSPGKHCHHLHASTEISFSFFHIHLLRGSETGKAAASQVRYPAPQADFWRCILPACPAHPKQYPPLFAPKHPPHTDFFLATSARLTEHLTLWLTPATRTKCPKSGWLALWDSLPTPTPEAPYPPKLSHHTPWQARYTPSILLSHHRYLGVPRASPPHAHAHRNQHRCPTRAWRHRLSAIHMCEQKQAALQGTSAEQVGREAVHASRLRHRALAYPPKCKTSIGMYFCCYACTPLWL